MPHCPHATRLWGSRAGTRPQSSLLGRPRSQGPGAVPGGGRGLRTPQRHPVGSPGARGGGGTAVGGSVWSAGLRDLGRLRRSLRAPHRAWALEPIL